MKYSLILLLGILLLAEGCRPPRCRIPNCYVRLKHRHGGENWKAAATPSGFNPQNTGQSPEANRGKVYRGVPWWKKNKNPKIGEGFKPGYKYDYRKPKYKKPKEKKSRNPEEENPPVNGEEQLTEEGEVAPQNEQPAEETAQEEAPETPKKKGLFGRKKEKKQKQPKEEAPAPAEQKPQEENDGF